MSIMWFDAEGFYRPTRPQNKSYAVSYNMATGQVNNEIITLGAASDLGTPFKVLGSYIYNSAPSSTSGVPIFVNISAENNPAEFALARAKVYRSAFQSQLAQCEMRFEIIGNPHVTVGSTVNLAIPRSVASDESIDDQLSGPFLVTAIHHKIGPINSTPRYRMEIKAVKAAYNGQSTRAG
jgi:hypothetical protein